MAELADLPLDRRLWSGLEAMGLVELTAIQHAVLPPALAGRDVMACAETGSGKTLAYLVPTVAAALTGLEARHSGTLGLILVPTRELARQVMRQCRALTAKLPVTVQALTGGEDFRYQAAALRKDPAVVIATPGRLLDHLQRGSVDLGALQMLVLDEADLMLALGFRDDVLAINRQCPAGRQAILVSATLDDKGVGSIAGELLTAPEIIQVGSLRGPHSRITHQLIVADSAEHKDALLSALLQTDRFQRALVFANKRTTATRLASMLSAQQLRCACLHGNMSTEERRYALDLFRSGRCNIVCASDLAARGLDVQNIDLVINYDVPRNGDDYLHRTGRTGRAGATGLAVSLVVPSARARMAALQDDLQLELAARVLPGLAAKAGGAWSRTPVSGAAKREAGTKREVSTNGPGSTDEAQKTRQRRRGRRKPRGSGGGSATVSDGFGPVMKKDR